MKVDPAEAQRRAYEHAVLEEMDRERAKREARRRLDREVRGPIEIPSFTSLRDRLARPRPKAKWRIEGWLPKDGRVMFSAAFKSGKTTAISNLLRSFTDGDSWLGQAAVTPVLGTVLLIDTEMSAAQLIHDWLFIQSIERDDRVLVAPLRGCVRAFDPRDPENRGIWTTRCREADVEVLILDCLRPLLDAYGLDEHRDAGQFLVALDAFLAEASIQECVVVHHMGHTNERARGDSRLRDWPDCEWKLLRQDDDPASARYISAYGRDVDVPESALEYDAVTRRLTLAGGSRRDKRTQDALGAVLDLLRASCEGLSVRAIQQALADSEHPRDRVRDAIKAGVRDGSIVTEQGPHRAILHRPCDRAAVCDERAAHGVSECASAYIDTHTHARTRNATNGRSLPLTQSQDLEPLPTPVGSFNDWKGAEK